MLRIKRKRKVYSSFKDNIGVADLADMQLISKCNIRTRFLVWVIDIFSNYVCIVPLKDKNGIKITNAFQNISRSETLPNYNQSGCKPNKISVDKGSKFYKRSMKPWLQDNDVEMKRNMLLLQGFFRTLKYKIYKYMTSISKSTYIDKSSETVNEFNNAYHRKNQNETN